jgi:hypothetical protein
MEVEVQVICDGGDAEKVCCAGQNGAGCRIAKILKFFRKALNSVIDLTSKQGSQCLSLDDKCEAVGQIEIWPNPFTDGDSSVRASSLTSTPGFTVDVVKSAQGNPIIGSSVLGRKTPSHFSCHCVNWSLPGSRIAIGASGLG